jgi:hypothetical protein
MAADAGESHRTGPGVEPRDFSARRAGPKHHGRLARQVAEGITTSHPTRRAEASQRLSRRDLVMSDDYKVDGLSNAKVRALGKRAREYMKLADKDQAVSFSHKTEALRDSASRASRIRFPIGTPRSWPLRQAGGPQSAGVLPSPNSLSTAFTPPAKKSEKCNPCVRYECHLCLGPLTRENKPAQASRGWNL